MMKNGEDGEENGDHEEKIVDMSKSGIEYLYITEMKYILEELKILCSELYCTKITMTNHIPK